MIIPRFGTYYVKSHSCIVYFNSTFSFMCRPAPYNHEENWLSTFTVSKVKYIIIFNYVKCFFYIVWCFSLFCFSACSFNSTTRGYLIHPSHLSVNLMYLLLIHRLCFLHHWRLVLYVDEVTLQLKVT